MASTKTFVRQTTAPQPFFKSNEDILEKLKEAKDLTYNMDLDDLAKVQPLDETRSTKLCENDSLQSMDTFNFQRSLNKQCLAYMDTLHPGEQLAFVDEIASKLPPLCQRRNGKGSMLRRRDQRYYHRLKKLLRCWTIMSQQSCSEEFGTSSGHCRLRWREEIISWST